MKMNKVVEIAPLLAEAGDTVKLYLLCKHKMMILFLTSAGNESLEFESRVESRVIDVEARVESFPPHDSSQVESRIDSSLSNIHCQCLVSVIFLVTAIHSFNSA